MAPLTVVIECLVAFSGGALSEAMCLCWVAASEARDACHAAVFSMLYAIAIERGVGEAIHTGWVEAAFVAGFGWRTYASVRVRDWMARRVD